MTLVERSENAIPFRVRLDCGHTQTVPTREGLHVCWSCGLSVLVVEEVRL